MGLDWSLSLHMHAQRQAHVNRCQIGDHQKVKKRVLTRTWLCLHSKLILRASRAVRKECLLFKPSSLQHFVRAANLTQPKLTTTWEFSHGLCAGYLPSDPLDSLSILLRLDVCSTKPTCMGYICRSHCVLNSCGQVLKGDVMEGREGSGGSLFHRLLPGKVSSGHLSLKYRPLPLLWWLFSRTLILASTYYSPGFVSLGLRKVTQPTSSLAPGSCIISFDLSTPFPQVCK